MNIRVTDVNDNAPVFQNAPYSLTISEVSISSSVGSIIISCISSGFSTGLAMGISSSVGSIIISCISSGFSTSLGIGSSSSVSSGNGWSVSVGLALDLITNDSFYHFPC